MHRTSSHVVIAEFEVKPDCMVDFLALSHRFSVECLESEPGCWQFDVVELSTAPNGVLFYEAYDNIDAFEAHCRSTHLPRFKDAFKNMIVAERPLRRGSRGHMAT